MAYEQAISTKEAAIILGYSEGYVCQLIKKRIITTAFVASPDGFIGKPGYKMYKSEIEKLAETRKRKAEPKKVKEDKPVVKTNDTNKDVKMLLEEVMVCLNLLNECLSKLKERL